MVMCIRKTQRAGERASGGGPVRGGEREQAGVGEEPLSPVRENCQGAAAWKPTGNETAIPLGRRWQPALSSAAGILAEDPYGV